MKINPWMRAILSSLLAVSSVVSALEIEPGVGVGIGYTNNAALTSDNEDNDWILAGYVGASIRESSAPFYADVTTSLSYRNYTNNTFSDQYYPRLGARAGWEMIRHRLDWQVQNYFTQQKENALDADTPDNDQNTNAFTFGPNMYFPISERSKITVSPVFQDFYYEDSDTDNRQYGIGASWLYKMYRTMEVGLAGRVNKVDFDNDDRNPDFTRNNVQILVSGTTARSNYDVYVGGMHINRDQFENQQGFAGNLTWLYRLTGHSSIRTHMASELTDTSRELLSSEITPDDGDFSNVQISGDVLRNNIVRITYRRKGSTLNSQAWGEYRDQEYKETPDDRDVKEIGVRLDYRVTPLLTTGIYGGYNRSNEKDTGRRDKNYRIGGRVGYNLSRKLRTNFDIRYQNEDSTEADSEYSEFSAFVSLIYGFDELSRSR